MRPLAEQAEDVRYVGQHLIFRHSTRQHPSLRLLTRWLSGEPDLRIASTS